MNGYGSQCATTAVDVQDDPDDDDDRLADDVLRRAEEPGGALSPASESVLAEGVVAVRWRGRRHREGGYARARTAGLRR